MNDYKALDAAIAKDHLEETLYSDFMTCIEDDNEGPKYINRLYTHYQNANKVDRKLIDYIVSYLCGSSLSTLADKANSYLEDMEEAA